MVMNRVKCPKCGKSNLVTRSTCFDCGSSLVNASEVGPDSSTGKNILKGAIIGAFVLSVIFFIGFFVLGSRPPYNTGWSGMEIFVLMPPFMFIGAAIGAFVVWVKSDF